MQSVQESKQELEASIRYAENAISSAKETIESMEFRQEMAKKQYSEQTGREQALQAEVAELRDIIDRMSDDAKGDSVTIKLLSEENTDLRIQIEGHRTNLALMTDENERLRAEVNALEQPERPTMPVIPKDVAIAIFREGVWYGASKVCDELDNASDICIEENEYCGDFEVSFSKYIDLSDHIDTNWLRDRLVDQDGYSSEENVKDALKHLCENSNFECRIHGVDDPQTKSND